MAGMISCPACQRQVSSQAPACPGCGHPDPGSALTRKAWKVAQALGFAGGIAGTLIIARAVSGSSADPNWHGGPLLLLLGVFVIWCSVFAVVAGFTLGRPGAAGLTRHVGLCLIGASFAALAGTLIAGQASPDALGSAALKAMAIQSVSFATGLACWLGGAVNHWWRNG